jgi:hypothetical protein
MLNHMSLSQTRGGLVGSNTNKSGKEAGLKDVHATDMPPTKLHLAKIFSYWSGREDSNLRPLAPQASTLPGCATPRAVNYNRAKKNIGRKVWIAWLVRASHKIILHGLPRAADNNYTFPIHPGSA